MKVEGQLWFDSLICEHNECLVVELKVITVESVERVGVEQQFKRVEQQFQQITFTLHTMDAGQCHEYVVEPVHVYKCLHIYYNSDKSSNSQ